MNKATITLCLATALTACTEPTASKLPSEAELATATAEIARHGSQGFIDQASQSSPERAPANPFALNAGPVTFCGYPPACPSGTAPVYVGCDARCYVLFGYDCFWGFNRVDCVALPPEASISGSPQTVTVPNGGLGTAQICWDTQALNYPVWIRVRVNGGAGQLFTKESDDGSACENAPWIQANTSYEFSIHDDNSDASPVYASTTVTGVPGGGGTGPGPGVCAPGGSGACPSGQDCHCGENFCTPAHLACP